MYYILWDFDGTLGYREGNGPWADTLYSILLQNNITNISREIINPYLSSQSGKEIFFTWHIPEKSHNELFKNRTWWEYYEFHFSRIFQELGLTKNISKKMAKDIRLEYINKTRWHLYEDTILTLEMFNKNQFKSIILSNHVPEIENIIQNLNIRKYFIKIYSSANIGYEKPNLKIYEHVLDSNKINKNDCIIIGDSYKADIIGGLNMGIQSILVRSENKNNYGNYCKDLTNIIEEIEKIIK